MRLSKRTKQDIADHIHAASIAMAAMRVRHAAVAFRSRAWPGLDNIPRDWLPHRWMVNFRLGGAVHVVSLGAPMPMPFSYDPPIADEAMKKAWDDLLAAKQRCDDDVARMQGISTTAQLDRLHPDLHEALAEMRRNRDA